MSLDVPQVLEGLKESSDSSNWRCALTPPRDRLATRDCTLGHEHRMRREDGVYLIVPRAG
jgi:hypothetical protein